MHLLQEFVVRSLLVDLLLPFAAVGRPCCLLGLETGEIESVFVGCGGIRVPRRGFDCLVRLELVGRNILFVADSRRLSATR